MKTDSRLPTGGSGGADSLPCLYRNNSIEKGSKTLSTAHRKSASALAWNVQALSEKYGLENLGFLTLTFKDHVTDFKEAQRRFNSLASNVLTKRYRAWISVMERCKSGRIHYHLLVNVGSDIRTGFDFLEIGNKNYKSANPEIRAEWAFWRKTAPKYRFGRTELLPVKSNTDGIANYVGKYIGKHMEVRSPEDKGARLVRYSTAARHATTKFAFYTDGSAAWRRKVALFAQIVSEAHGTLPTMEGLKDALGPKWAYNNREFILALPDPMEPQQEECTDEDSTDSTAETAQQAGTASPDRPDVGREYADCRDVLGDSYRTPDNPPIWIGGGLPPNPPPDGLA